MTFRFEQTVSKYAKKGTGLPTTTFEFQPTHYREVGLPVDSTSMCMSRALALVNHWNTLNASAGGSTRYWIP